MLPRIGPSEIHGFVRRSLNTADAIRQSLDTGLDICSADAPLTGDDFPESGVVVHAPQTVLGVLQFEDYADVLRQTPDLLRQDTWGGIDALSHAMLAYIQRSES